MSDTYSTEEMAPGDATEPGETSEPGEAKASQQEVNYRAGTPLKNCGLCEHFEGNPGKTPDGCESVDGTISPFGYCDIYLRQPNPFGDQHQYKDERRPNHAGEHRRAGGALVRARHCTFIHGICIGTILSHRHAPSSTVR